MLPDRWCCKMRILFLIVPIVFPFLLVAQASSDTIIWGTKQLVWSDFKANPDTAVFNQNHHATTLWKLRYQYKPLKNRTQLIIYVEAWFDARKSWVRKRFKNDQQLLQHEQAHFDLAELLARRFRKKLAEQKFTATNYYTAIDAVFNPLLTAAYQQQTQYDRETNYGEDKAAQQQWQQKIAAALNQLAAYASTNLLLQLQIQ